MNSNFELNIQLDIYDSAKGKKVLFEPENPNQVKIYSCGPTVYNYSHIGNIRSYIFVDTIRRTLKLFGFIPDQTMNITDIDDKIISESIKSGISIEEFTSTWTDRFFLDIDIMNIERVEHYPKATESIEEMIDIIVRLQENGLVYEKDGSYYFSINKFQEYGNLNKIDKVNMLTGVRFDVDEYDKENPRDFVLWKAPKVEGERFWNTKLGKGRPGWHLECSAMIRSIYNSGVDIHTGGIDLLFPHHENELAQSRGAYPNEDFVKYWLHCEHLLVDGQKMSKSKGNYFILKDLLDKGYSWQSLRYVLISYHYRTKLNFSFQRINEASLALKKIQTTIDRVLAIIPSNSMENINWILNYSVGSIINNRPNQYARQYFIDFMEGLADDFNMPKAMASIFDSIKSINSDLDKSVLSNENLFDLVRYFFQINSVLGVLELSRIKNNQCSEEELEIESLIRERMEAKSSKNYLRADEIRDNLLQKGIQLEDSKDGFVKWKRIL